MSALKPQPLPYTKRGIFGAPASQGFTGIGQRVGQGVTDFWTSLGSGVFVFLVKLVFQPVTHCDRILQEFPPRRR